MNLQTLRPLPCQRTDEGIQNLAVERDGFVDDAVVFALMAGPVQQRHAADADQLVLSADDMDFAGWSLSPELRLEPLETRRAAPPVLEDEPGLGEPHRGSHRWWIAGLAGAFSTLLFSMLLLTLSERGMPEPGDISIIRVPAKPQPATEARATEARAAEAPALTGSPSAPEVR